MALVVGRGRRAVRLVGGHGTGPAAGAASTRQARPPSRLGPRRSRRGVLRYVCPQERVLSGCGHSGAAHRPILASHKFHLLDLSCGFMDMREHCGRRPGAWKRRTGKTQIFSLAPGQGNFNFEPD